MAEEQLILVDEGNRATGSAGKTAVHRARPSASRLFDLHRRRPRPDRAAAAQSEKISFGRAVGEFLLRASAPRRTHHDRGAPPARRGARRAPARCRSASSHATGPSSTTACTRTSSSTSISGGSSPSLAPIRPRSPMLRCCPATTIEPPHQARSRNSFAFWFKHYFRDHGADIARLAKAAARRLDQPVPTRGRQCRRP